MRDDFCVFILTHGRPSKVMTYKTLRRSGYTGKIFIVVDDEDKTIAKYKEKYGEDVLVFSKDEVAKTFDLGDNFHDKKGAIIFARNACFDLAKKLGFRFFMQLDDDYNYFAWRFNAQLEYEFKSILRLDVVFSHLLHYYENSPFASICMSQGGDFIGGSESSSTDMVMTRRKAMNTFICSVDRPFTFVGRINEDVNTYTAKQRSGLTFITVNQVSVGQKQTQSNSGGMTELYVDSGTYIKSMYSVMMAPSCVKVRDMGDRHRRIHHVVSWDNCAPKIVPERFRRV